MYQRVMSMQAIALIISIFADYTVIQYERGMPVNEKKKAMRTMYIVEKGEGMRRNSNLIYYYE